MLGPPKKEGDSKSGRSSRGDGGSGEGGGGARTPIPPPSVVVLDPEDKEEQLHQGNIQHFKYSNTICIQVKFQSMYKKYNHYNHILVYI